MNEPGCIFCQIVQDKAPAWKVYEDAYVVAFFDINPVNAYHTLVIPKPHYENIFDTPVEELQHVITAVKKIADHYQEHLGIENVQIINSSGREAQQDVFHLHFHIVPRHAGDGQNIRHIPHREYRDRFDDLLEKIGEIEA
ncbi:MAG: HIT domain-containing protein [Anaerolineae bacterium]|jgi:histidine triad (HIT) family protein|nr:HIT domain-containing protein [Anaerolineae bacterium]